jgi:hypothetical protein
MVTHIHKLRGKRSVKDTLPHMHQFKGLRRHRRFPLRKTNRLVILIFMLVLLITLFLTFLQLDKGIS